MMTERRSRVRGAILLWFAVSVLILALAVIGFVLLALGAWRSESHLIWTGVVLMAPMFLISVIANRR